MKPLGVVHTIGSIAERTGGPSRTVTQLCSALCEHVAQVALVAGRETPHEPTLVSPGHQGVALHVVEARRRLGMVRTFPGFGNQVKACIAQTQDTGRSALVHDHGMWFPTNRASWQAAQEFKVPYLLSPRGMLEPWALRFRAWKKKATWLLFQQRMVASAAGAFATSEQEMQHVKALFPLLPVAVIPNGVEGLSTEGGRALGNNESHEFRRVLFMSRVHPKKNLGALFEAWASVMRLRPALQAWKLQIAGPDELGYTQEMRRLAASLGIQDQIEFLGPQGEAAKARAFAQADLFVLPSLSENFGVVVAEAMAAALPVIATTGTPWSCLAEERCGWWVPPTVAGLEAALIEALSTSEQQRLTMGQRGRTYAVKNFGWECIAESTAVFYDWILSGKPKGSVPRFVHV